MSVSESPAPAMRLSLGRRSAGQSVPGLAQDVTIGGNKEQVLEFVATGSQR